MDTGKVWLLRTRSIPRTHPAITGLRDGSGTMVLGGLFLPRICSLGEHELSHTFFENVSGF